MTQNKLYIKESLKLVALMAFGYAMVTIGSKLIASGIISSGIEGVTRDGANISGLFSAMAIVIVTAFTLCRP